jgi:lysophospholipase L1-like esterase
VNTRGHLISGLVTTVVALAGFVTAGTLPAGAAPSSVPYVALGDSYAAGTAAAGSPPNCPHGDDGGYPALLAGLESRIDLTANAACSGARTSDVANQLSALDRNTRLVTVTVGAANLGLSAVLAACSNLSTPEMVQECRGQITRAQGILGDCTDGKSGELDSPLAALYADIADKARGARIVVTGYPLLFDPPLANNFPFRDINAATADLNCVIERAVAATQRTYANIHYVDVTNKFAKHAIGGTLLPFINPPPPPNAPPGEAFHPTREGYSAYADAISATLPGGWVKPLA